jgi:hypothetical protein
MKLTWGEFKAVIEDQGVEDSDPLEEIDFSVYNDEAPVVVFDGGGFSIE